MTFHLLSGRAFRQFAFLFTDFCNSAAHQLTMQQPADVTGVTDTDQRGNGNGETGVGKILGGKSSHIARL